MCLRDTCDIQLKVCDYVRMQISFLFRMYALLIDIYSKYRYIGHFKFGFNLSSF